MTNYLHAEHPSDVRILRMAHLEIKTKRSKSSLYDIQNPRSPHFDPTFPKRRYIGARSVGWFEHEVDAWLLSRKHVVNAQGGEAQ